MTKQQDNIAVIQKICNKKNRQTNKKGTVTKVVFLKYRFRFTACHDDANIYAEFKDD